MEHNCVESIRNNVFGTLNTVEVSEEYGVERFIVNKHSRESSYRCCSWTGGNIAKSLEI